MILTIQHDTKTRFDCDPLLSHFHVFLGGVDNIYTCDLHLMKSKLQVLPDLFYQFDWFSIRFKRDAYVCQNI